MLTQRLEFAPERDQEIFAAVPSAPAVFLLRGHDESAEPYVSKTANLRRRLQRLLGPADERTKKLNLRERVRAVEYSATGSDFESGFLLYKVLREIFPKTYAKRLRFRFAPFVKLHLDNPYPRASITSRLGRLKPETPYYGPFPSRVMAEKFMNDSLDFFKMRRCVEELQPDPSFPGCIYSEMKMCLAPCFKGCSDAEYAAEVVRVQKYFESGGQSLERQLAGERDSASANLAFEDAAALHARIEKVHSVTSQLPEIVHRLDRLEGLMIQPSHENDAVTFFRVHSGALSAPVLFSIEPKEHAKSQSMESRIEEALADAPAFTAKSSAELMEHVALLKRWYFRSSRLGEIFFADEHGDLPMRRIVRAISRVYRGEKPETQPGLEAPAPASPSTPQ